MSSREEKRLRQENFIVSKKSVANVFKWIGIAILIIVTIIAIIIAGGFTYFKYYLKTNHNCASGEIRLHNGTYVNGDDLAELCRKKGCHISDECADPDCGWKGCI